MWSAEPNWGDWSIPESQLRLLPDVAGMETIELGCGTAYFSGWLARAGARPVGVDASARQLSLARALQEEHGLEFPLVHADAEQVPYPDGTFDLALSEYGAGSWCDPHRWLPEAARLLRPGGWLLFLTVSPILTSAATGRLGQGRRPAAPAVLRDVRDRDARVRHDRVPAAYGDWVRVLCEAGFTLGLTEMQAPAGGTTPWPFVDADWAHRWPSECVVDRPEA